MLGCRCCPGNHLSGAPQTFYLTLRSWSECIVSRAANTGCLLPNNRPLNVKYDLIYRCVIRKAQNVPHRPRNNRVYRFLRRFIYPEPTQLQTRWFIQALPCTGPPITNSTFSPSLPLTLPRLTPFFPSPHPSLLFCSAVPCTATLSGFTAPPTKVYKSGLQNSVKYVSQVP